MLKKLTLSTIILSTLLLTGCGGGGSDSEQTLTPKNILLGKVLYSVDSDLDESTGYYRDIFGQNTLTETEHAEDGTQLYEELRLTIVYNKDTITVSKGNQSDTCTVKSIDKGVQFNCNNPQRKFTQWYRIADIVR
jgi:hypothetical protein